MGFCQKSGRGGKQIPPNSCQKSQLALLHPLGHTATITGTPATELRTDKLCSSDLCVLRSFAQDRRQNMHLPRELDALKSNLLSGWECKPFLIVLVFGMCLSRRRVFKIWSSALYLWNTKVGDVLSRERESPGSVLKRKNKVLIVIMLDQTKGMSFSEASLQPLVGSI